MPNPSLTCAVESRNFPGYSLQKLPAESVGPLLKVTEDAKWSRFIFQAQTVPKKLYTLRSRSSVVSLPFFTKDVVLANLNGMNFVAHYKRLRNRQETYFWEGQVLYWSLHCFVEAHSRGPRCNRTWTEFCISRSSCGMTVLGALAFVYMHYYFQIPQVSPR